LSKQRYSGNPFRRVSYISPADEILSVAFKQTSNLRIKSSKRRISREEKIQNLERERISTLAHIISEKLERTIDQFPWIESLHPFYGEICDLLGDIDEIRRILGRLGGIEKQIREMERDHVARLKETDHPEEMAEIRNQANGRMASLVKKARGDINYLIRVIRKLKTVPDFNVDYPTVVIAGAPNVGKSSLVREISTGKPEVGEYPFTTKEIVFGHRDIGITNIQVVDTPGLLDRPFRERNLIERQSIVSIRHISDIILFMFDISKDATISLEEQFNLFEDIEKEFPNVPIIRVLNKTDLLSEKEIIEGKSNLETQFQITIKDVKSLKPLIEEIENVVKSTVLRSEKFKEILKLTISDEFLQPEEEVDYKF
jgi:nucleolar GTP-binding protein